MRNRKQYMLSIALGTAAFLLAVAGGNAPFSNLGATTVQSQILPPPPPHGGPGGLDLRLLDQLSLTDTQKAQVKELLEAEHTASQPYREELMQAREGIRTAVEAVTFDETGVRALATIVGQATADLTVLEARTKAAIYQLLTAEQRAKLAALRTQLVPPPR